MCVTREGRECDERERKREEREALVFPFLPLPIRQGKNLYYFIF